MFSILNASAMLRNSPPMVCKFLDSMTAFFHACLAVARRRPYLFEQLGFRNSAVSPIGLPIAIPLPAAYIHFRKGKD
jgi:hypothetical protein